MMAAVSFVSFVLLVVLFISLVERDSRLEVVPMSGLPYTTFRDPTSARGALCGKEFLSCRAREKTVHSSDVANAFGVTTI